MNNIENWIELSISDLNSSKLLYKNKHYRTSYFLFQQAVEKANKAYGLFNGIITEDEIKKIGHDQLKIYRKSIIAERKNIQELITSMEPYPKIKNHEIVKNINLETYNNNLNNGLQVIDDLRNYDLVKIPIYCLNNMIKILKDIEKSKIVIPRNSNLIFEDRILKLVDWIGKFETTEANETKINFEIIVKDKKKSEEFYNFIIERLPFCVDLTFIAYDFYFCTLITIQHSSLTRYPMDELNPLEIYTEKLSLIKKQYDFMNLFEKALIKLQKFTNPEGLNLKPVPEWFYDKENGIK